MELTKTQIQEIDNRLKKDGIKYWDIRIEMLDHVVTDVENRLENGEELEKAITNSFISLGWKGNLKHLNRKGWQNTNDKYRREHFKGILNYFKSFKNIFLFVVSVSMLFYLSNTLTFKVFKNICVTLFSLPIILIAFLYIKQFSKKYKKSVNLDYGSFYLTLSYMILPSVFSIFNNQQEFAQKIIWIVILSIHFLSIHSGYNLYKKSIEIVEDLRKQLLL